MSFQNWFKRGLAALGIPLMLGAAPAAAKALQTARPALWEVSDPDTRIYLFGTIHLLPDDMKWRSAKFDDAVANSQQLIVETIVDQQNLQSIQQAKFQLGFARGLPPIAERVPAADLPKLRAAIKKSGAPEQVFDQMKTWLAAITLLSLQFQEMGLQGSHGPEEILRQQFISTKKPIGELETNLEQFSYFDRLPEKAQRQLLQGAIEPTANVDQEFKGMLASWSRGDVRQIANTFNRELSESKDIRENLLDARNANWARWIEHRLAEPGTIMVAVGAGHLAGKGSVLDTLRKNGYKIRRLQ
jgi:uncharacterized protein YbaP (TraB family)